MNETEMAIADRMRRMDLAQELGKVLRVNPVRKGKFVIYELADDFIKLSFNLKTGRWWIITGSNYGIINLPKEAPDLMAAMSETIEEISKR